MTQDVEQIEYADWYFSEFGRAPDTESGYESQITWKAWQAAHARYAMPECHSVIDGKRTEDMDSKELRYHLQESSRIMQRQADEIEALKAGYAGETDHQDDKAVDNFAEAMKLKMARSREKGRGGWDDPLQCSGGDLASMMVSHIAKGDPVDVANFCMMIHQRCVSGHEIITAMSDYVAEKQSQQWMPAAWRYKDARGNYRYRGYVDGFDAEYKSLNPERLFLPVGYASGLSDVSWKYDASVDKFMPDFPAPAVPESRNVKTIERQGDQSVKLTFASCRSCSAFVTALTASKEGI